jgi:hypothetical protein
MDSNVKKVFIIGNEFRHCEYSNNPMPPVSFYPSFGWEWNTSLVGADDLLFFTESTMSSHLSFVNKNKIAWLIEPRELVPHHYEWIKNNHRFFKHVLTHERSLLEKQENFKFIPFGGCWIAEVDRRVHNKTKLVSVISSEKTQLSGHKLRHDVIGRYSLDVFGRGYNPVNQKIEALGEYAFSVVIENCKRDYWFTEKLIDCLITGTIPIYWGCPSIGDFFDLRGIIVWNTLEELNIILEALTLEKYNEMYPFVMKNQKLAKKYVLAEKYIDGYMQELL